jgi:alginate O-acetyltransferase complex protein AlgI
MIFTSFPFLFVFLPLLLLAYWLTPFKHKNLLLTIASYIFYAYWRLDFLLLIFFSTVVDYSIGLLIQSSVEERRRKLWLGVSLLVNLGLLGYFKYFNFGIENFNSLLIALGLTATSFSAVLLPVGISFYTFQTMSYSIDIYRRKNVPTKNFIDFACFVSMFPQLIAGPIVRYYQIRDQLKHRQVKFKYFAIGVLFLLIGINKKILFADTLGMAADGVFAAGDVSMLIAWIGVMAFSLQIYFDFSGYSDMAVGLGYMLGFKLPQNFDSPYKSQSITEFWRRWHITLSSWLRDYLYIPLGGNRSGKRRTYINLILVMLIGGLWHGSAWTFIVWGLFHGIFLAAERMNKKQSYYYALPVAGRIAITWLLICISWVPFRADSIGEGMGMLANLFDLSSIIDVQFPFALTQISTWLALAGGIYVVFGTKNTWQIDFKECKWLVYMNLVLFVLAVYKMSQVTEVPFLYFQF